DRLEKGEPVSRRLDLGRRAIVAGLVLAAAAMAVLGAGVAGGTHAKSNAGAAAGAKEGHAPAAPRPASPSSAPDQGISGKIRPSVPDPGLLAAHAHGPTAELPSPVPM